MSNDHALICRETHRRWLHDTNGVDPKQPCQDIFMQAWCWPYSIKISYIYIVYALFGFVWAFFKFFDIPWSCRSMGTSLLIDCNLLSNSVSKYQETHLWNSPQVAIHSHPCWYFAFVILVLRCMCWFYQLQFRFGSNGYHQRQQCPRQEA